MPIWPCGSSPKLVVRRFVGWWLIELEWGPKADPAPSGLESAGRPCGADGVSSHHPSPAKTVKAPGLGMLLAPSRSMICAQNDQLVLHNQDGQINLLMAAHVVISGLRFQDQEGKIEPDAEARRKSVIKAKTPLSAGGDDARQGEARRVPELTCHACVRWAEDARMGGVFLSRREPLGVIVILLADRTPERPEFASWPLVARQP
ncbi:hypothetical protein B0T19DRAFT_400282 [Cercophora scortea]|uniref:Uncharacterized protein n=1 Tax=Cercophora scortea TaxID=314031 RepID=A0AAE0IN38_9PEZI|nr:hypothetical protein B0T19DRAFT_400282 [Cercophora scortea]